MPAAAAPGVGPPCWPRKPEFGGAGALFGLRITRNSNWPAKGPKTFQREGA